MTKQSINQGLFWQRYLQTIKDIDDYPPDNIIDNGIYNSIFFGNTVQEVNSVFYQYGNRIFNWNSTTNLSSYRQFTNTYSVWLNSLFPKPPILDQNICNISNSNSQIGKLTSDVDSFQQAVSVNFKDLICKWALTDCIKKNVAAFNKVCSNTINAQRRHIVLSTNSSIEVEPRSDVSTPSYVYNFSSSIAGLICETNANFLDYLNNYLNSSQYQQWLNSQEKIYNSNLDALVSKLSNLQIQCFGPGYQQLIDTKTSVFLSQSQDFHPPYNMLRNDGTYSPSFVFDMNQIENLKKKLEEIVYNSSKNTFVYSFSHSKYSSVNSSLMSNLKEKEFLWSQSLEHTYSEINLNESFNASIEYDCVVSIDFNPGEWFNKDLFLSYDTLYDYYNPFKGQMFGPDGIFSFYPIKLYIGINPKLNINFDNWSSSSIRNIWNNSKKFGIGPFAISFNLLNQDNNVHVAEITQTGIKVLDSSNITRLIAFGVQEFKDGSISNIAHTLKWTANKIDNAYNLKQPSSCKSIDTLLDVVYNNKEKHIMYNVMHTDVIKNLILANPNSLSMSVQCLLKNNISKSELLKSTIYKEKLCNYTKNFIRDFLVFEKNVIKLSGSINDYVSTKNLEFCKISIFEDFTPGIFLGSVASIDES